MSVVSLVPIATKKYYICTIFAEKLLTSDLTTEIIIIIIPN